MKTPTQTDPPVALHRLVRHSSWLPIETAPKDGTKIKTWHPGYGSGISYWTGEINGWKGWAIIPSYWMPLPSLPNVQEHAPPLAGAHVEAGGEVHVTDDVADKAASGGCCASPCSLLFICWKKPGWDTHLEKNISSILNASALIRLLLEEGHWVKIRAAQTNASAT